MSLEGLKFIYETGRRRPLQGIITSIISFAANEQRCEREDHLNKAVRHKHSEGERKFRINADLACLVGLDGQPFTGIAEQIFVGSRGDCIKVCNGKLTYPDGGDIEDLEVLSKGQEFSFLIDQPSVPRNIFENTPRPVESPRKQEYVSNFWSDKKESQITSAPQDQPDAKLALKPTP